MPQLRSVRVAPVPIPVRVRNVCGRLVNVSATGALVQLPETARAKVDWPLLLSVEPDAVELRAQVVRSSAVSVELEGATWRRQEYAVALAFTGLSPMAREALHKLCGDAFSERE